MPSRCSNALVTSSIGTPSVATSLSAGGNPKTADIQTSAAAHHIRGECAFCSKKNQERKERGVMMLEEQFIFAAHSDNVDIFVALFVRCPSSLTRAAEPSRSKFQKAMVMDCCLLAHPPGAVNVQIYRLIKEWTAWDIARRAAFAFFGIFAGIEENLEFLQSVEAKLGKDAKIIVACSTGGTMKPTQNLPDGKQSSLLMCGAAVRGGTGARRRPGRSASGADGARGRRGCGGSGTMHASMAAALGQRYIRLARRCLSAEVRPMGTLVAH